jgi:hypothetical protein
MGWNALGTQFCLELAFGVLVALAFVPKAPVGPLFYRIMATTALAPLLVAVFAPVAWSGARWSDAGVSSAAAAALACPLIAWPVRGKRWWLALAWSACWTVVALAFALRAGATASSPHALEAARSMNADVLLVLCCLSAMATGCVAGSVSMAMVLGHWYLTVPTLQVKHLQRLNRVTVASMLACIALLAITCTVFAGRLNEGERPLLGATGLFYLGTRVATGLVLPLVFAWMTASSLKFRNTRSATGILYASTILVLIGTAVSISLQDSYGIPL